MEVFREVKLWLDFWKVLNYHDSIWVKYISINTSLNVMFSLNYHRHFGNKRFEFVTLTANTLQAIQFYKRYWTKMQLFNRIVLTCMFLSK